MEPRATEGFLQAPGGETAAEPSEYGPLDVTDHAARLLDEPWELAFAAVAAGVVLFLISQGFGPRGPGPGGPSGDGGGDGGG